MAAGTRKIVQLSAVDGGICQDMIISLQRGLFPFSWGRPVSYLIMDQTDFHSQPASQPPGHLSITPPDQQSLKLSWRWQESRDHQQIFRERQKTYPRSANLGASMASEQGHPGAACRRAHPASLLEDCQVIYSAKEEGGILYVFSFIRSNRTGKP